jgi:hypothetical protein
MKRILLVLTMLLSVLFANAQKEQESKNGCATDWMHWKKLKDNPHYKAKFQKYNADWFKYAQKEEDIKAKTLNKSGNAATPPDPEPPIVTLTVAFHDLTTVAGTELTTNYDEILLLLNNVYAGSSIVPGKGGSTPTGIRFCLAKEDARGVVYNQQVSVINGTLSGIAPLDLTNMIALLNAPYPNSDIDFKNVFPSSQFINIYIVDDIAGAVAGFSSFPSDHGDVTDGIFVERRWMKGDMTTPLNEKMNVLIHEMGHYLGLYHVFGVCDPDGLPLMGCYCENTNCLTNGDMVCDTLPMELNQASCSSSFISCQGAPYNNTIPDDRDNYMDYNSFTCLEKFTDGQVERIRYTVNENGGIRESLLKDCPECLALAGCQYSIVPSPNTPLFDHQIQVGNSAGLTIGVTGCTSPAGPPANLTYLWELSPVPGTLIGSATTQGFTIPGNLAPGSYQLKATVTLRPGCFRTALYTFAVITTTIVAPGCNLTLPTSNASWTGWNRSTYSGGWKINQGAPFNFTYAGSSRTAVSTQTLEYNVLTPAMVNSDPNFGSVTNTPASLTQVIRVGRRIDGQPLVDGAAAYASVKFTPTRNNCKYRIYYLGVSNKISSSSGDTSFGFLCQYRFNSPVTTPTGQITTVGSSESGLVLGTFPLTAGSAVAPAAYNLNDMDFGTAPTPLDSADNIAVYGSNYNVMKAWKYMDVDFSEFVDAAAEGLNTEVTITFYARTNSAISAKKHSYAYFGVECMGGGIPQDYALNLSDATAFCSECVLYNKLNQIVPPHYAIVKDGAIAPWLQNTVNFSRVLISSSNNDGVTFSAETEVSFPSAFAHDFALCYISAGNPNLYTTWRIRIKTLHNIVEQTIRIYKGAIAGTVPPFTYTCPEPYGGHIPPGQRHEFVFCSNTPVTSQPVLVYLDDICFTPPAGQQYIYRWMANGNVITGETGPTYQIDPQDFPILDCYSVTRQVRRVGSEYCDSAIEWVSGEPYNVYRLNRTFIYTKSTMNICRNGTYTLDISNFKTISSSCGFPAGLITPGTNNVTIQLFMSDGITPLTAPYTIPNFDYGLAGGYSFSLSFNNWNGTNYFLDYTQDIKMRITSNLNNMCPKESNPSIQIVVRESAIGGTIQLDNTCSVININNVLPGFSYPNTTAYYWEIAPIGGSYVTLANQIGNHIDNIQLLTLPFPLPVQIRRVSYGSPECASPDYSNAVIINPLNATPTFNNLLTCAGSVLPTISSNNIQGTWNPATVTTTGDYTFTPNPGQCAVSLIRNIIVTPLVLPTFTQVQPICVGGTLVALPTTSTNSITGSWLPPILNTSQTTTYTFTPNAGQCAGTATMQITVNPIVTPAFNAVAAICTGSTLASLPTSTSNGITGSWAPPLNNALTTLYTFTPAAGQCANTASLSITVNQKVNPNFPLSDKVCLGDSFPFGLISPNGIPGSWAPAFTSSVPGATVYTFTPDLGQCANTKTTTITVLPIAAAPSVVSPVNYCLNDNAAFLTAGPAGANFYWYTSIGGSPKDQIKPGTTTAGTTTYYVTVQGNDSQCQSPPSAIAVIVGPPIAVTVSATTQPTCGTPTGSVLLSQLPTSGWSLSTYVSGGGGTPIATGNLPEYTIGGLAPGVYNYSINSPSGCTAPVLFTVHVDGIPEPIGEPKIKVSQPSCEMPTGAVELYGLPQGTWIVNETGPMGAVTQTFTGTSVQIPGLEAGSYSFTVTNSMGCTSTAVFATINASPLPDPLIADLVVQPSCPHQEGSIVLTGMLVPGTWHITQTGTTEMTYEGTDPTHAINHLGVGIYYFTVRYNGCESAPIMVTMLEATTPAGPEVVSPLEYNVGDTGPPLTAIGENLHWYYPTDIDPFTGTPTPSTDIPGDFVYYVTQTVNGCESPPVKIVVKVTTSCENYTIWDGSNWSHGVPDLNTHVIINGDYDMQNSLSSFDACRVLVIAPFRVIVTAGSWVNIDHELTVKPGATFDVMDDGSLVQIDDTSVNHGNIIYRRDVLMKKFDYVYWSSPVSNFSTTSISPASPTWSIFKWNTTYFPNGTGHEGLWVPAVGETMAAGKGYIVRAPLNFDEFLAQDYPAVFDNGVPNNGVITQPVSKGNYEAGDINLPSGAVVTHESDNFNLLGNPYPSAIDAVSFFDANPDLVATVYLWTHGENPSIDNISPFYNNYLLSYEATDLTAINITGAQGGPGDFEIAGAQGFFVILNDDPNIPKTGLVATFNNSMRSKDYNNSHFARNANQHRMTSIERSRIWLDIADSNNSSARTLLGYVTGATIGKDNEYDGFLVDAPQMQIYSLVGDERMVIQGRPLPFDDNDQVPLGFTIATVGTYSVAISAVDGIFDNGQDIYVEDMLLHRFHDLKVSPYSFTSTAGRFLDRFRIVYKLPPPTVPVFDPVASVCNGSTISQLPTTSLNGITGIWAPAVNNTATTTYTFTPNADQNATSAELTIVITPQTAYYQDSDNDGYGNAAVTTTSCATTLTGYVTNATDCNDTNASIHPGAVDVCYDGIDNDCDGVIDNVGLAGGCNPITTTLSASSCDSIVAALNTTINAIPVADAQGYRFKVTNVTNGAVQLLDRSVSSFSFSNLSNIVLATQYKVEVAVKINNVWQPFYGTPCFVTTPIPYTQIGSNQCSSILGSVWDTIYCSQVSGVTNYHVRAVASNGTVVEFNSASYGFNLNRLGIQFATTYTISISVYQHNGNWIYGNSCTITTPAEPARTSISNCGAVISSFWNTIFINQVASIVGIPVTGYRVELSDAVGGTRTLDIAASGFNLKNTNFTPYVNPTPNTVYTIRIALLWNGSYQGYGPACTISTAANATKQAVAVVRDRLEVLVTPNPFTDNFTISIQSPSNDTVEIRVYDMIGKLIDRFEIEGAQKTYQLGGKYPSGVYNIILNQSGAITSVRIIKR